MTLLVLENLDESNQRKLFPIMGTEVMMTSTAWLNIPLMLVLGIAVAWFLAPAETAQAKIFIGIGYGILFMLVSFGHGLGHIISSKMVGAPMKRLIATATVFTGSFEPEEADVSSRQHIGRAIGGPAFNAIIGVISLALYATVLNNHFVLLFGAGNIIFTLIALVPLPTLDGSVLLREMRK